MFLGFGPIKSLKQRKATSFYMNYDKKMDSIL